MYKIFRPYTALGDKLLASFFTHILNDNGISCFFENEHKNIIDCSYEESNDFIPYEFIYQDEKFNSIIGVAIEKFKKRFCIDTEIKIIRDFIPVKYKEIEDIPKVDVVMVTKSSDWAPVRDWPYFEDLKKLLQQKHISFIDITQQNIKNFEFLNYVKKCKVFVTLETGASHYASQFINKDNSLVIQSGYCDDSFWNFYKYDVVKYDTNCKWCFTQHKMCENDHKCMKEISVDVVFNKILQKIKKNNS